MSAEDLGGATVHCKTSGVSDYFAQGICCDYADECIENAITIDINLVPVSDFVHVSFLVDEPTLT